MLSWSPSNPFRLSLLLAKEDFFLKPSLTLYLKISEAMTDQVSLPYFVIFLLSAHHCHTVLFFFFCNVHCHLPHEIVSSKHRFLITTVSPVLRTGAGIQALNN